ncbi:Carbohydrate sulfotransferase 15 [Holothuria leucospilota]|uniref:Carbohydrate sulfotransferase 15 n=1 Tax=Holothuria leucospilota TaxID=206669 RepID=A0A9Q1BDU5_HOLLE|nr:Carbohydrate sulfotransferase 15 [Holothuria leucospilota]
MVFLITVVIFIIALDHSFMQSLKTPPRRDRWGGDYRLHQKDEQRNNNLSKGKSNDPGEHGEEKEKDRTDGNDGEEDEKNGNHYEDDQDFNLGNSQQEEAGDSLYYDMDRHHEGESHRDHFEEDPALEAARSSEQDAEHGKKGASSDLKGWKEKEERKEDVHEQKPAEQGRRGRRPKGRVGEVLDDFSGQWNITIELRRLAPVIFKFVPPKFHPGYQGFCWYNAEHEFRCLPYFYLLGMPKCGTTDIWQHIVGHPYIVRVLKEPHWWTRNNRNMARVYISRSKSTVKLMEKRPSSARHYIFGDGSASYLWDMKRWQDYFNPDDPAKQLFLPHVIKTVTPKAKLIAAFREPVARLYSEYVYFSANPTPESFHDKVVQRLEYFQRCTREHSERKCIYQIALENGDVRPMIGMYSAFARDWLDVFPREQMLFIRLEDWHLHCEEYLPKIFLFLEVEALSITSLQKACKVKSKNVNDKKKAEVGPMLEKTKILLREFYSRWNQDLASLLQDDRWLWNDVID